MIPDNTATPSPSAPTRRDFLKRAGLAGAATAAFAGGAALFGTAPNAEAEQANATDLAVLNFALNLEYLEAEFYLRALGRSLKDPAEGVTLTGSGGAPGTVTVKSGSTAVPFTSELVRQYALEIAEDEKDHVLAERRLIQNLGGVTASLPNLDLVNSFNTLAAAAGISSTGFDPFASDLNFLLGAFIFEDVGVTAYKGAAPLLTSKRALEAAAGVLAVEASHSAIIRTSLFAMAMTSTSPIAGLVQKISDLRDALDGPTDLDQPLFDSEGNANLVVTDSSGIAFSRNTRQVLNIVYGAPNASSGLFFPKGLRGAIK